MEDLTGRIFGRLTAIEIGEVYIAPKRKNKIRRWICSCSCGNTSLTQTHSLLNGTVTSCGCLRKERSRAAVVLPVGVAAMHRLYDGYKRGAVKYGRSFTLSLETFKEITQQPCHYCGKAPSGITSTKGLNGEYTYNGIDRQDNKVGYEDGNVVPCCKQCNMMKGTQTVEEFLEGVSRVYRRCLL